MLIAAVRRLAMCIELIAQARQMGASDLHLTIGAPPVVRLLGELKPLKTAPVTAKQLQNFIALLSSEQKQQLEQYGELDCAWSWGEERYRLNIFRQRECYALACRLLNSSIPTCKELGLPSSIGKLSELQQGLVLFVGPTGSGKTTSLSALVQRINLTKALHIITLEDPIEYEYPKGLSLVHQREVGRDTQSFASGLRAALREDPDVILVGELRDAESMGIALTAAETGHLVLATMHTKDVTSSINRILDSLPHNPQQVRSQLAECLQAVISQRLLPRADGKGRVAAFELLLATDAVRHLIREGQTHQLQTYLQTGAKAGMLTLADSIKALKQAGIIS